VSDRRVLLSGTLANVVGLAAGVAAAFAVQVMLGRALAPGGLGLVTVAVQAAFVAAAGSRLGMDMAALRQTAVALGTGGGKTLRSLADRCAGVAAAVSAAVAAIFAAGALLAGGDHASTLAAAALALPPAAAANVYLGATRGLKEMRPTLYVFWFGQPLAWLALAAVALAAGGDAVAAVAAYDVSWLLALVAARALWRRRTTGLGDAPASAAEVRAAVRYGVPRGPAALLAQLLFWADLFVLARFASGAELDAYAAASRLAQLLLLFLTSVNLIFTPFVADLHARGRTAELDRLFKDASRWALAATLPVVIVLAVAAGEALAAFGPGFAIGDDALRILLAGQLVNVATGSVAYVLLMAGHTGVDLADNALAVALLVAVGAALTAAYGMEGTALAAAGTIAVVNVVRLVQVRRLVGISPFSAAEARLLAPAAACAAAAVAAHLAAGSAPWWADLAATAAAGAAGYALALPVGLPAAERAAIADAVRRITNRPSRRGTSTGSA
jgi:O-antigen/teichoic acid export membrane protein